MAARIDWDEPDSLDGDNSWTPRVLAAAVALFVVGGLIYILAHLIAWGLR